MRASFGSDVIVQAGVVVVVAALGGDGVAVCPLLEHAARPAANTRIPSVRRIGAP
jgi:hypothetical protein